MTYKNWYLKYGVLNKTDMLKPTHIKQENFFFPIKSEVFITGTDNVAFMPGVTKHPALHTVNNAIIITMSNLSIYKGRAVNISSAETKFNITLKEELTKTKKHFRVFEETGKSFTISNDDVVIKNFGGLNSFYRYDQHLDMDYYRWYNEFKTMCEYVSKPSQRQKFLVLDVGVVLCGMSISKIDTLIAGSESIRQVIDLLPSKSELTTLELFRTYVLDAKSMLRSIPKQELPNITLILSFRDKLIPIQLDIFLSLIDDDIKVRGMSVLSQTSAQQLLLAFLNIFTKDIDVIHMIDENNSLETAVAVIGLAPNNNKITSDITIDKVLRLTQDTQLSADVTAANNENTPEFIKSTSIDMSTRLSPYDDKIPLKEAIAYKETDYYISDNFTPDSLVTKNDGAASTKVKNMDTKYLKELYPKDILNTTYSIESNLGYQITEHTIKKEITYIDSYEIHTMYVKPPDGRKIKVSFKLPIIDEEGIFKTSGNSYMLLKQKGEVPVKKINRVEVALTSYYGKLFVTKAEYKKNDLGYFFRNQIVKMEATSSIVLKPNKTEGLNVPSTYGSISRYVNSFRYQNIKFIFDYKSRLNEVEADMDTSKKIGLITQQVNKKVSIINKYESQGSVLIGVEKEKDRRHKGIPKDGFVFMTKDNTILYVDWNGENSYTYKDIFSYFEFKQPPIEYVGIHIFKQYLPIGLLLSYYSGIEKLSLSCGDDVKIVEVTQAVDNSLYVSLIFKDKKIIFLRDNIKANLILGGLTIYQNTLKNIPMESMNDKDAMNFFFNLINLPPLYVNEIKFLEKVFIDPITKTVLETLKMPITFDGIILKAAELLMDDNYKNPNSANLIRIKGYERIAGMLYKELMNSARTYDGKKLFSKPSFQLDPFSIWNRLTNDNSLTLVDDTNPLSALKLKESITLFGSGGLSRDALSTEKRITNEDEIGIIGEAHKDNGSVGGVSYLTASPSIHNIRGFVSSVSELNATNILTTPGLMSPFILSDSSKRGTFSHIMASQRMASNVMRAPRVRTEMSHLLARRVDKKFCTVALKDGIVKIITKTHITVQYDGDEKETRISIGDWLSKEEAGTTYTHSVISNVMVGERFETDNVLTYDNSFFEPDIFNKNNVVYKTGMEINVALSEIKSTLEDSLALSSRIAESLGITPIKTKTFPIEANTNIINLVKVKDSVLPTTALFTIVDAELEANFFQQDDYSREVLASIKGGSPKAEVEGEIYKIRCLYNCDKSELSQSLLKIVEESDRQIQEESGDKNINAKVNSSYSIKGVALLPGMVELKFFIQYKETMGIGDKAVLVNQLKCTLGDLYDHSVTAESGEYIDAFFSSASVAGRIVDSPFVIAGVSRLMERLEDLVVEEYFKGE